MYAGHRFFMSGANTVRVPNHEPQSADRKFSDLDGRHPVEAAGV